MRGWQGLDDEFATLFAEALATNTTLLEVNLESNAIGGRTRKESSSIWACLEPMV